MNNNFFYKNLEFNATFFKTHNGLFLLAKDKAFYGLFIKALKTIPNNPKKKKNYKLLLVTKSLKENISREIFSFDMVEFIYDESMLGNLLIGENEKMLTLRYNNEFIVLMEEAIQTLQWNNPYGEVSVEGIVLAPDWW